MHVDTGVVRYDHQQVKIHIVINHTSRELPIWSDGHTCTQGYQIASFFR